MFVFFAAISERLRPGPVPVHREGWQMKIVLSLATLVLFLMACSAESELVSTSSSKSKESAKRTEQVAYHVTGMKKAASGAI
ncbi:MAG: PBP1b-binding outer membrane lipoprotein LpoB [Planctomycetota bacterium]|jgi:PBP1b-binding outer membrane lipoprotein LpoB